MQETECRIIGDAVWLRVYRDLCKPAVCARSEDDNKELGRTELLQRLMEEEGITDQRRFALDHLSSCQACSSWFWRRIDVASTETRRLRRK